MKNLVIAVLMTVLPLNTVWAGLSGTLEDQWAEAGAPFDQSALSESSVNPVFWGVAAVKKSAANSGLPVPVPVFAGSFPPPPPPESIMGPWDTPARGSSQRPIGLGPVSWNSNPGYLKGLLGGLLGLILAPIAFMVETAISLALMPARMVKGLMKGDLLALLEPVKTARNIVQDAAATAIGMLNCASAPIWNALYPHETTDFMFANDRMIFLGGPVAGGMRAVGTAAMAPSQHTLFYSRGYDSSYYNHEYVHGVQWRDSFLWEKIGENYHGYSAWNNSSAYEYLNL